MNKKEIEAVEEFINTPITAENLEPLKAVFPEPSEPTICGVGDCELPAIGQCCCGVVYCSVTCQERHLDEAHE